MFSQLKRIQLAYVSRQFAGGGTSCWGICCRWSDFGQPDCDKQLHMLTAVLCPTYWYRRFRALRFQLQPASVVYKLNWEWRSYGRAASAAFPKAFVLVPVLGSIWNFLPVDWAREGGGPHQGADASELWPAKNLAEMEMHWQQFTYKWMKFNLIYFSTVYNKWLIFAIQK